MEEFLTNVREACGQRRIDHRLFLTDEDLGEVLSHYLHYRARSQHLHSRRAHRPAPLMNAP